MRLILSVLIFFLVGFSSLTVAQEKSSSSDLRKIADNMRFENALQFTKLKKYDLALTMFHEYLEVYYDGSHRDEAYRQIANVHMQKFEYALAVKIYERLYQEFSNDEVGVNAYYSKGLCFVKMGYDNSAQNVFDDIIKRYPGTKAAFNSEVQRELLKISSN